MQCMYAHGGGKTGPMLVEFVPVQGVRPSEGLHEHRPTKPHEERMFGRACGELLNYQKCYYIEQRGVKWELRSHGKACRKRA